MADVIANAVRFQAPARAAVTIGDSGPALVELRECKRHPGVFARLADKTGCPLCAWKRQRRALTSVPAVAR